MYQLLYLEKGQYYYFYQNQTAKPALSVSTHKLYTTLQTLSHHLSRYCNTSATVWHYLIPPSLAQWPLEHKVWSIYDQLCHACRLKSPLNCKDCSFIPRHKTLWAVAEHNHGMLGAWYSSPEPRLSSTHAINHSLCTCWWVYLPQGYKGHQLLGWGSGYKAVVNLFYPSSAYFLRQQVERVSVTQKWLTLVDNAHIG